jgi:hypothetical protein
VNIVIWSAIIFGCSFAQQAIQMNFLPRGATTQQTPSLAEEKRSRTPAQKKIDSHLLNALKCSKAKAGCQSLATDDLVKIDRQGRVRVDIRVKVTPQALTRVRQLGGKIIAVYKQYQSIEAQFPLSRLEDLAKSDDVKFIGLKAQPMTSELPRKPTDK